MQGAASFTTLDRTARTTGSSLLPGRFLVELGGLRLLARHSARSHICAYHQWSYDTRGNLKGVPFRRGLKDSPGMPADFDVKDHGLQQLRVESYRGLVFATFSDRAPSLCDYIGPQMRPGLGRIFHKPIVYLDRTRQYSKSNWSATPSAGERAEGAVSVDQGRDLLAD